MSSGTFLAKNDGEWPVGLPENGLWGGWTLLFEGHLWCASEVTTLWRCTNLFVIIIIVKILLVFSESLARWH